MRGEKAGQLVHQGRQRVLAHDVTSGTKGSTSTTYRWEDNTDPVILARVWDGTTTAFSVDVEGFVSMTQVVIENAGTSTRYGFEQIVFDFGDSDMELTKTTDGHLLFDIIGSGSPIAVGIDGHLDIFTRSVPAAPDPGMLRLYVANDGGFHPQLKVKNSDGTVETLTTFADGA